METFKNYSDFGSILPTLPIVSVFLPAILLFFRLFLSR